MDDSTIFIVGANGQLGTALQAQYPNAKSADIEELDITDQKSVEAFDWSQVSIIINAAAYTNVDGAETPGGRVTAWQVNAAAVGYLVKVAAKHNITIVHISTDYVFDGSKDSHTEYEAFSPLSVYGASKAAGDIVLASAPKYYILRTSWVIGEGKNFAHTMLELGQKGINPSVVSDQVGRLTFTSQLVQAIDYLLTEKADYGTYNVSNGGQPASWAEISRRIFEFAGLSNAVTEATTEQYYQGKTGIAPRPLKSTLDLSKIEATGLKLVDWQEALREYVSKEISK